MSQPHTYYFKPPEFNRSGVNWHSRMCPRLLVLLDLLRHELQSPVVISPVDGATGRYAGESRTQHNVQRWGQVRAADFFCPGASPDRVIAAMTRLGFTGIGHYPDGLYDGKQESRYHGDTRRDRVPGEPATWGYRNGVVVSLRDTL